MARMLIGEYHMRLILDTNFYLHYTSFDQCPWDEFLGSNQITLLVTPTILAELDEKKRDLRDHINRRARQLTLLFDDIYEDRLSNPLKCGINVEIIYPIDTSTIDWEGLGLNKSIKDDRILAEILALKNEDDNLIFVTADRIPRMKAESLGITTKIAPHEWMRDIKDTRDKKIRALEEEIKRLKKASLPKVKLYLKGGDGYKNTLQIPIGVEIPDVPVDINIDDVISILRQKYDGELQKLTSHMGRGLPIDPFDSISGDEFKNYKKQINGYLDDVRSYFYKVCEYSTSVIEIPLVLANIGEVPADDVDVTITIPKDLLVQDPPTYHLLPRDNFQHV